MEIETFLRDDHGAATTHGILLARPWPFESATKLKALRHRKGGFHPPQTYRYIESEELVKLID